jgi:hypothetical protein
VTIDGVTTVIDSGLARWRPARRGPCRAPRDAPGEPGRRRAARRPRRPHGARPRAPPVHARRPRRPPRARRAGDRAGGPRGRLLLLHGAGIADPRELTGRSAAASRAPAPEELLAALGALDGEGRLPRSGTGWSSSVSTRGSAVCWSSASARDRHRGRPRRRDPGSAIRAVRRRARSATEAGAARGWRGDSDVSAIRNGSRPPQGRGPTACVARVDPARSRPSPRRGASSSAPSAIRSRARPPTTPSRRAPLRLAHGLPRPGRAPAPAGRARADPRQRRRARLGPASVVHDAPFWSRSTPTRLGRGTRRDRRRLASAIDPTWLPRSAGGEPSSSPRAV